MFDRRAFLAMILATAAFSSVIAAAEPIDPTKATSEPGSETLWYDIQHLDVEGRGWTDTKEFFDRLPGRAEGVVREPVWNLSRNSAGMCVRFVTNAPKIEARWNLISDRLALAHMPSTGVSGLDLYVKHQGRWRWLAVGIPKEKTQSQTAQLASNLPAEEREFLLYLPLYNGVSSVAIGLPKDARLAKADPYPEARKPIIFYGTSITQGGCASRPGMVHTAIVGRRLNYPVLNLGFSGNGRMEPEMAKFFAELDPSVYILDCLPNMNAEQVTESVEPFVATLRAAHSETPILLVEDRSYTDSFLNTGKRDRNTESRAALHAAYERLTKSGVPHLHYLKGDQLLGEDGEATVDSSHPTDLGFVRQAYAFELALRPILRSSR